MYLLKSIDSSFFNFAFFIVLLGSLAYSKENLSFGQVCLLKTQRNEKINAPYLISSVGSATLILKIIALETD
jgi:hypothetical protein